MSAVEEVVPLGKVSLWLCNKRYKAGSTNRVNKVDEITPPMTTVASGRWTSEPMPVLSAIGTKPSEATSAVVSTGLTRQKYHRLMPREHL